MPTEERERSGIHRSVEVSGSAGRLFEGSGPLRAQKGVQRLENEHFVLQVLLDPFLKIWTLERPKRGPAAGKRTLCTACLAGALFGRFGPLKRQKGVQQDQNGHMFAHVVVRGGG